MSNEQEPAKAVRGRRRAIAAGVCMGGFGIYRTAFGSFSHDSLVTVCIIGALLGLAGYGVGCLVDKRVARDER